jgi:putative N6-adenine-specific DNA methylase
VKENLAVATLLSASRPFSQPLRDPCCGSGTLLIEAARLAKNIAPGWDRNFAFESFPDFPEDQFHDILKKAQEKEINKTRTII